MEQNLAGACEDKDPEFLHDFLHAARRTPVPASPLLQCLSVQDHQPYPAGFRLAGKDYRTGTQP